MGWHGDKFKYHNDMVITLLKKNMFLQAMVYKMLDMFSYL